jgi:hypothetical protein
MVGNKIYTLTQKMGIHSNFIGQGIDNFFENIAQVFFQGGVAVLVKQGIKEGQGKKLSLGEEDAFDKKVIFRVIIPALPGIVGKGGMIKKTEVINITQNSPGVTSVFLARVAALG